MKLRRFIVIVLWCLVTAWLLLSYKPSPWTPPDYSGQVRP